MTEEIAKNRNVLVSRSFTKKEVSHDSYTPIPQILYIKGIILENIATDLLVLIKKCNTGRY